MTRFVRVTLHGSVIYDVVPLFRYLDRGERFVWSRGLCIRRDAAGVAQRSCMHSVRSTFVVNPFEDSGTCDLKYENCVFPSRVVVEQEYPILAVGRVPSKDNGNKAQKKNKKITDRHKIPWR